MSEQTKALLDDILPLSARDIELILACLGDGTYTRQEAADFRSMGQQALLAIELDAELAAMKGKS